MIQFLSKYNKVQQLYADKTGLIVPVGVIGTTVEPTPTKVATPTYTYVPQETITCEMDQALYGDHEYTLADNQLTVTAATTTPNATLYHKSQLVSVDTTAEDCDWNLIRNWDVLPSPNTFTLTNGFDGNFVMAVYASADGLEDSEVLYITIPIHTEPYAYCSQIPPIFDLTFDESGLWTAKSYADLSDYNLYLGYNNTEGTFNAKLKCEEQNGDHYAIVTDLDYINEIPTYYDSLLTGCDLRIEDGNGETVLTTFVDCRNIMHMDCISIAIEKIGDEEYQITMESALDPIDSEYNGELVLETLGEPVIIQLDKGVWNGMYGSNLTYSGKVDFSDNGNYTISIDYYTDYNGDPISCTGTYYYFGMY